MAHTIVELFREHKLDISNTGSLKIQEKSVINRTRLFRFVDYLGTLIMIC
jgi:hypothetical protein